MKKRNLSVGIVILVGSALLTACAQGTGSTDTEQAGTGSVGQSTVAAGGVIQVQNVDTRLISVNSSEKVSVLPDVAEIRYGVYTQAKDAKTCQENNGKDLEKLVEVLKKLGFEEKSIQTYNYDLSPIYDWDSGRRITGYEMETMVTLSDIPLEKAGEVISGSVEAGVNNIRSVTYMSSKYDEAYQEALTKAVESARTKAEAMAEAGNCTLGGVMNITEYSSNQQARYSGYETASGAMMEGAMDDAANMVVMPGEVEIEANIEAVFAVND